MPVDAVRDAAIDVLLRVFERDAFVSVSLDKTLRRKGGSLSPRGKRFLSQLVYGTTRHKLLCEHVIAPFLHQPFSELPGPIRVVLCMGVFQSLFCRQVTFPAMVSTSVDLAKKRGHAGTARLSNAVLRKVPQSLDDLVLPDRAESLTKHLSVRYSLSPWIVESWLKEYGDDEAEVLCKACDAEAPKTLRVNVTQTTREAFVEYLKKNDCLVAEEHVVPESIKIVDGGIPFRGKPFQQGHFYVQDEASMLAPHLLAPEAGERILDLCSAPGGKGTHIAELTGDEAEVVCLDPNARKLSLVRDNAQRLGLRSVKTVLGDGECPPISGDFDRVLVDAPCTGLGTLRRHPELKWRSSISGPSERAELQRRLLRSGIELCKNNGVIVYSVCTFTAEETSGVIDAILGDNQVVPEDGPSWLNQWKIGPGQYRILPREGQLDGYFLMRLRKGS